MRSIEDDIKKALREMATEKKSQVQEGCPPEEILILYMEGGLAERRKNLVTEHLSFCPDCLDIVALETAAAKKELEAAHEETTIPSRAVDWARNLVRSGTEETLFDIVVRLCHGTLEIIHSALHSLPPVNQPALAALRSAEQGQEGPQPLRMEKAFNGISAEIQVEASQEGTWSIQVFLKGTQGPDLPDGLRITLKDLPLEKELQSAPVRGGVAVFSGLSAGEYEIEIREFGQVVGTASIRLT